MDRGAYRERIAEVMAGSHGAKVGYPIELRELEVVRTEQVGSGLLRITFGGSELAGFHSYVPDEHVRVVGQGGVQRGGPRLGCADQEEVGPGSAGHGCSQ